MNEPTPLRVFFTSYAFTYNPNTSAHKNFTRLCHVSGWTGTSPQRSAARMAFKDALVQQFNFLYGVNDEDISVWHNLCNAIAISPLPTTIEDCRKRVWDAHVNIVDLIEAARLGQPVRQFDTLDELAEYTKKSDRFFPKENAYQGGLLKELLREIINPYFGQRRNGSQKRKARRARKRDAEAAAAVTLAPSET